MGQSFVRANGYCLIRLPDAVFKYLRIGGAHEIVLIITV